jgi:hypothetical protein
MLQEKHGMWLANKKAAWERLEDHQKAMRDAHLRDLFANHPGRGRRMTAEAIRIRKLPRGCRRTARRYRNFAATFEAARAARKAPAS